jgi:cell division protease FtsH
VDPWLPIGLHLPTGVVAGRMLYGGERWQVLDAGAGQKTLLVDEGLALRWFECGLLGEGQMSPLQNGPQRILCLLGAPSYVLAPVREAPSPEDISGALSFAGAMGASREKVVDAPLHDALFVEQFTRLLPTWTLTASIDDATVLGTWLTGGVRVSMKSTRRLQSLVPYLSEDELRKVAIEARLTVGAPSSLIVHSAGEEGPRTSRQFKLPGRVELETFFAEHILDVLEHPDRYEALGIGFPGAVVFHGPPGCGKTYAVEQLVDHLGWPSFAVSAGSIASPYIHDTSRKIADLFGQAERAAPSVLIIDEMDAFLTTRDGKAGAQHRVEEVAEFLRALPRAREWRVLVFGMTNRLDVIDPAVLRRGRIDHVVQVCLPSPEEVGAILAMEFKCLPTDGSLDTTGACQVLAARPVSDVVFVVREAARLTARAGRDSISQEQLDEAVSGLGSLGEQDGESARIGFR